MRSDTDNHLWLRCWEEQHIDFHQSVVNPLLSKFWPSLKLIPGSRVFVPLCGKSLDMIWLAQQGHEVIGVELSPIAAEDFFQENGMLPLQQRIGRFTLWSHGRISILCGDYFSLSKTDLGVFDTVYDRAALTALPEQTRSLYVKQLGKLAPKNAQIFLLTIEDAADNATLQQAMGVDTEIKALYSTSFDIDLTYVESICETDLTRPDTPAKHAEYKVYRLSSKYPAD